VEQDDGAVPGSSRPGDDGLLDYLGRRFGPPLLDVDVPTDVPVPEQPDPMQQAFVVPTRSERQSEPGPRIDADVVPDNGFGGSKVDVETTPGEERHPSVVEGVVPDQMPGLRDPRGGLRKGLDPAALQEECRPDRLSIQEVEQTLLYAGRRRPIGVLGVERERDPEAVYFSTPVITMPRTKKRWKIRKAATGTTRVMSVPAWIRPGSEDTRAPLKLASPTATVWSSGALER
jgi:hypothetical protein